LWPLTGRLCPTRVVRVPCSCASTFPKGLQPTRSRLSGKTTSSAIWFLTRTVLSSTISRFNSCRVRPVFQLTALALCSHVVCNAVAALASASCTRTRDKVDIQPGDWAVHLEVVPPNNLRNRLPDSRAGCWWRWPSALHTHPCQRAPCPVRSTLRQPVHSTCKCATSSLFSLAPTVTLLCHLLRS
jgi:hypothetical protein